MERLRAKGTSRLKSKCTKLSDLLIGGQRYYQRKALGRIASVFRHAESLFYNRRQLCHHSAGPYIQLRTFATVTCGNAVVPLSLSAA